MQKTHYVILKSVEYKAWLIKQCKKAVVQIEERLDNVELKGHFGDHKPLDKQIWLWELRWKNGRRIYYFRYISGTKIWLLLGGHKNDQKKDIRKAKHFLEKYTC